MAIRKIINESDETLRKISKPVVDFDDRLFELIEDMKDTLAKAEGAGLAAVQVGVLKRLFVMHAGKEEREWAKWKKECTRESFTFPGTRRL